MAVSFTRERSEGNTDSSAFRACKLVIDSKIRPSVCSLILAFFSTITPSMGDIMRYSFKLSLLSMVASKSPDLTACPNFTGIDLICPSKRAEIFRCASCAATIRPNTSIVSDSVACPALAVWISIASATLVSIKVRPSKLSYFH